MEVRKKIIQTFKLHGLSLQREASQFLSQVLSTASEKDLDGWLDRIVESVQKQPLSSTLISKREIETAVSECSDEGEESVDTFHVISAFELPRFKYDAERRKYIKDTTDNRQLHPDALCRVEMFKDRYMTIYQRTIRHELFVPQSLGTHSSKKTNKYELTSIECLLGSTVKSGDIIVLGMIAKMKEGKYHLEDSTGVVEMDLTKTKYHIGLFTESCLVLAEGVFEDGVFHVKALGLPPCDPAQVTRNYFGNINFFGGPSTVAIKSSEKLRAIEEEDERGLFAILSDVCLDSPKVMEKLRTLFHGYHLMPPTVFILCGNFISEPGPRAGQKLREGLNNLADLILEFPSLVESRFVFVPGPQDPGPGSILPRPAIFPCLRKEIQEKIPYAIFATNPCRIQYCTQEIVVFREDLVSKMCRHCIHLPSDPGDIPSHLVKTVLSQARLCPLPHHTRPVYWNHDNALRVYPVPDLLILADKYHPYLEKTNLDCICLNPGSFSKNDFCFKAYWPATKDVEESKVPDQIDEME